MKTVPKIIFFSMLCLFLSGFPIFSLAQDSAVDDPREAMALLKEQNNRLSNDIRRIHREIAALRADLDKPDIKDIFGGIGYILGLCGVAALVAARRKREQG